MNFQINANTINIFMQYTFDPLKETTNIIKRGRGRPTTAIKRPNLNRRVDADVLDAFKATGQGWQTRINAALREAVAHGLTKT